MGNYFLAMPVTLYDYAGLRSNFEHLLEGRWMPEQNLHLTLQFFGRAYEKEFLLSVLSQLQLQAEGSHLKGLDLLKNRTILYAKTLNPSLAHVSKILQNAFGLYDAREFTPHVTLLRIKKVCDHELLNKKLIAYEEKSIGKLHGEIALMHSRTGPEGTCYSLIKQF
jgi:2'-5' RNA ligase